MLRTQQKEKKKIIKKINKKPNAAAFRKIANETLDFFFLDCEL